VVENKSAATDLFINKPINDATFLAQNPNVKEASEYYKLVLNTLWVT